MAPDTFTHTTVVAAARPRVWDSLQDPEVWGEIGGVDRVFDPVHDQDGVLRRYGFLVTVGGRGHQGHAETTEVVAPERMVVAVTTAELRGGIAVELGDADSQATRMSVLLSLEATGFLTSLLLPVIARAVGSGLPRHVEDFARRLERS